MNEKEALETLRVIIDQQGGDFYKEGHIALNIVSRALSPSPVTPDASGLLPCPFCSMELEAHRETEYDEYTSYEVKWYRHRLNDDCPFSGHDFDGSDFVKQWNARASSSLAELEAENERQRKLLEDREKEIQALYRTIDRHEAKLDKRTKALEESIQKLETYGFECEAGPLSLCKDWIELKGAVNGTNK